MKPEVSNFLGFLNSNDLVDIINIQGDNEVGFKNRFRLQKLIYLAQSRFNLPNSYFYSLYKNGPYSRSLADDVYGLDVTGIDDLDNIDYQLNDLDEISIHYKLPPNFDEDRFISLLSDKDEKWLEISSTLILAFDKKYHEKSKLIEFVSSIKPGYPIEYIRNVFSELVREKLILTILEELNDVVDSAPDLFEALAKEDVTLINR